MSFKVIGIGEVLWDLFPSGPQLGGAPANFAYHAHALGARAGVITRVGKDSYGTEIRSRLAEQKIESVIVQVDETAPTGTVTVSLSGNGIPHFNIHENVAWDRLAVTEEALAAVRQADAICFGTLAQRSEPSRSTIRELLQEAKLASLKILDINLRQQFYNREVIEQSLGLANVLKLNEAELPMLCDMFKINGDLKQRIVSLAKSFELAVIALTMGPKGSILYQNGRWSECPARSVEVKDTVGAGDSFTAALVMGLLRKMDLDHINFAANEIAQYVCTCAGATPLLPNELRALAAGARRPVTNMNQAVLATKAE